MPVYRAVGIDRITTPDPPLAPAISVPPEPESDPPPAPPPVLAVPFVPGFFAEEPVGVPAAPPPPADTEPTEPPSYAPAAPPEA